MTVDSPLVRQWNLLKLLSARRFGVSIAEMVEETGVSAKTIRRDLEAFVLAGFPLEEKPAERGKKLWHLSVNHGQPEISFAFDQALALYLGRRFLEPLAGTMIWQAAQQAFKKVRASLGKPALAYLDKMTGHLHTTIVGASDYTEKSEIIDALLQAVEERKVAHIEYQSLKATEPVTYEICPYGITFHRGSLYLVAFSRDHNELRHFKIDRVEKADVSQFPFPMPDDFDLARHLASSFGIFHAEGDVTVKVRFAQPVARYVQESQWHASQKLSRQRDGSLLAEFRLSTTEEIKRWLMSFGRHATVLEPEHLRKAIAEEAQATVQNHSPGAVDRREA
jgi:proteasome accessory factor B